MTPPKSKDVAAWLCKQRVKGEAAQLIVDASLRHLYKPGFSPAKLYDDYQDFGEDPFIVSDDPGCKFSAWTYAKSRCAAICEELAEGSGG